MRGGSLLRRVWPPLTLTLSPQAGRGNSRVLDNQGIHHRHALTTLVHEHGVEIDLGNLTRVVRSELAEAHHQLD